jgi:hypothetical protein
MSREEANGRGASTREQLGIVKDEEGGHGNSIGGEGREWSGDESGASQSFMRAESSRAGDTSSAYETDDWCVFCKKHFPLLSSVSTQTRAWSRGLPPFPCTPPLLSRFRPVIAAVAGEGMMGKNEEETDMPMRAGTTWGARL